MAMRPPVPVPTLSRRAKLVMHHDVGGTDEFEATDGDQPRIPRARSHEEHLACFHHFIFPYVSYIMFNNKRTNHRDTPLKCNRIFAFLESLFEVM